MQDVLGSLQYSAFEMDDHEKVVSICEKHWQKHCDEKDRFDIKKYFLARGEK
jgi:hypothetical protein